MKSKISLTIKVLLVVVSILLTIYTYSIGNKPAYLSSIVAICGTIALLVQDIYKLKKEK